MKEIAIILDDRIPVSRTVKRILNKERYSDIVLKKIKLAEMFEKQYSEFVDNIYLIKTDSENEQLNAILKQCNKKVVVMYIPTSFVVVNDEAFVNVLKKIRFTNDNIILDGDIKIFKSIDDYFEPSTYETLNENSVLDLSKTANFFKFISNEADVRHFNALTSDGYTFVKSSTQKNKIKAEYSFYYLLPDNMKVWFVQPFDYTEDDKKAYYRMERYRIPDSAIYHVNNSFNPSEFKEFIDKLFYFVNIRKSVETDKDTYFKLMDELYLNKLKARIEDLKKLDEYDNLASKIKFGTKYNSIDDIIAKYESYYAMVRKKIKPDNRLYAGHGDLCFSNILYDKETYIMKLIDPKGAVKEEDIYTNQFYDIAKLSHSVLGDYDFYNSGLFDINLDNELKYNLQANMFDIEENKAYFRTKLEEEGFDYVTIRVFECSLFLSMLPLHIDYPAKVFAFILNAINILEEIEKNVR